MSDERVVYGGCQALAKHNNNRRCLNRARYKNENGVFCKTHYEFLE